jgi:hypothetical protein
MCHTSAMLHAFTQVPCHCYQIQLLHQTKQHPGLQCHPDNNEQRPIVNKSDAPRQVITVPCTAPHDNQSTAYRVTCWCVWLWLVGLVAMAMLVAPHIRSGNTRAAPTAGKDSRHVTMVSNSQRMVGGWWLIRQKPAAVAHTDIN